MKVFNVGKLHSKRLPNYSNHS